MQKHITNLTIAVLLTIAWLIIGCEEERSPVSPKQQPFMAPEDRARAGRNPQCLAILTPPGVADGTTMVIPVSIEAIENMKDGLFHFVHCAVTFDGLFAYMSLEQETIPDVFFSSLCDDIRICLSSATGSDVDRALEIIGEVAMITLTADGMSMELEMGRFEPFPQITLPYLQIQLNPFITEEVVDTIFDTKSEIVKIALVRE